MNDQAPKKLIYDQRELPVSVSHCTTRVNRDFANAFSNFGTPHLLRFRRVFKNTMELNGLYDIYIDSDYQLLLYADDRPGFISVFDSTGTPVTIPVYRFSGMEPYVLPLKQPTPFPYLSPEDVNKYMEVNHLLTKDNNSTEAAANDRIFSDDTMLKNSKKEEPVGDILTTIRGTDISDESDADYYAKPEPIFPQEKSDVPQNITKDEINEYFDKANKTITDIKQNSISQVENAQNKEKQTVVTEQSASVIISDKVAAETEQIAFPEELIPASDDDIAAEQIDLAEETLSEVSGFSESGSEEKIENDNTLEYYAKQLIQKPESQKSTVELSIESGVSVSVSEENIHNKSEQPMSQNTRNREKEKNASVPEDNASSAKDEMNGDNGGSLTGISQAATADRLDVINSGAQFRISDKIGIENKRLCLIERPRPERDAKKEDGSEEDELQLEDIFRPIANFCLVPLSIEHHIYIDDDQTLIHTAVFSPVFQGGFREIIVNAADIEKVAKTVRQSFPQLYYDPGLNSAPKYVSTAFSMMMSNMVEKAIAHFYGWRDFNGRFIYLNDNIDENPLFKSESGKSLPFIQNLCRGDALLYAFRMLKLSKNINKTLPLFLTAHMGVMYYLFEAAGYAPRFVLFLRGETGSLKTSISKVFFRLLADESNEIPANFNDTMVALEIKMGMTRDEVFLVDDFRPSSMNAELAKMRGNLEKLIRFYGDGIGKGRGSIELKLREEFKPHSMCAVTGEYIHGTASSLQRLLIVSVDKNTYDRGLLKFYQDHPQLFRTHINFFITYLSQNAQRIINHISSKFIEKRTHYTYYLSSKRLVDTAVCMELTAEIILLFYANECNLVHPLDVQPQLDIWKKCILDFVKESETLSNNREPVDMFCTAIAEIVRNDMLKIPLTKTLYESNIDYAIGYYDYHARTLYLKPKESYTEAVQYWSRQGITFAVKERALRQELLLSGMVRGSIDGDVYKSSTPIRINGKAVRMLELDLIKFNDRYKAFALPPSPIVYT